MRRERKGKLLLEAAEDRKSKRMRRSLKIRTDC